LEIFFDVAGVYDDVLSGNGVEASLTIMHFFTIFFFLFAGMLGSFIIFVAEKIFPPKIEIS
jgi:hypothetical protein